jgi:acyl homoserine lactone synthase
MHRLRARVFSGRLNWDVEVVDGRERDTFDDLDPLYGLSLTSDRKEVRGCFRLLQTTGPNMLSEVFRELLPDCDPVRSPLIWESTRFCVDTAACEAGEQNGVHNVTIELISSLFEIGLYAGLSHIVTVIDLRMERIMRRVGCPMDRLAPPRQFGKVHALAVLVPMGAEIVHAVHARNKLSEFYVTENQWDSLRRAA